MFPKEISENTKTSKASSSSSTSSWSKFKDPRIVRVSRAFGGKDRHSKVCTVRGLRDRRVRLSVPTAIQLYDLQDRLGLNQPSKVVDWLLNAAKQDIDELPPLHIPQGLNFTQNYNPVHGFRDPESNKQALNISLSHDQEETRPFNVENPSFLPSVLNNSTMPSFVRWDPRFHGSTAQIEDWHNLSLVPLPSTLSIPNSVAHQFLVYQPGMSSTQPYFPSQIAHSDLSFDLKEPNFHSLLQLSNSSYTAPQHVRPIHFGMTANLLASQSENEQNKGNEFHSG